MIGGSRAFIDPFLFALLLFLKFLLLIVNWKRVSFSLLVTAGTGLGGGGSSALLSSAGLFVAKHSLSKQILMEVIVGNHLAYGRNRNNKESPGMKTMKNYYYF